MPLSVINVGAGVKKVEVEATVFRACKSCGEHNPSPIINSVWEVCPKCGTQGTNEKLGTIMEWHKPSFLQSVFNALRDYLKRISKGK